MIIIDSREQKGPEIALELSKLGVGEFRIEDTTAVENSKGNLSWPADFEIKQEFRTIGIQRKTISDFVSSLDKLKETMELGRAEFDVFCLLLEGQYELNGDRVSYRRGKYFADSVQSGSLHNFELSQGLRGSPVLYSNNLEETARVLRNVSVYEGPHNLHNPHSQEWGVISQYPGIGGHKAKQILREFGSVYKALDNIEQWAELDGIGEKTVERVWEFHHG